MNKVDAATLLGMAAGMGITSMLLSFHWSASVTLSIILMIIFFTLLAGYTNTGGGPTPPQALGV